MKRTFNELPAIWTYVLECQRDWLRHVGHGGLDGIGGSRVAGGIATRGGFGVQFFCYRVGLWGWTQRDLAGENYPRKPTQDALRCNKDSAQKSPMAEPARIFCGRIVSAGVHRRVC